jgi:hypothetical protein
MSCEYIDSPSEDAAFSLRAIRDDITRIADTLDDYLTLTMTISEMQMPAGAGDLVKPLYAAIERIKARRAE